MKNLPHDQAFPRTMFLGEQWKLMPNITDEKRQEIDKALNMQMEVLGLQLANQKLQMQGQNQMLKGQLQEMQAPPPQPGTAGPGGKQLPPPPGSEPPPPQPGQGGQPLTGGPEIQALLRSQGPVPTVG